MPPGALCAESQIEKKGETMKICPVCESALFDDMGTCFGCLYRFGSDPALEEARGAAVPWPTASDEERAPLVAAGGNDLARASDGADGGAEGTLSEGGLGGGSGGGRRIEGVREVDVPGWRLRVRSEGPLPRGSALVIEIEPAP